jgi:regulator of sigma D
MLFLLRQIRRNKLMSNRIVTYLLYAIGEIILVVAGILIAVTIDDRNELIKRQELEKKYFLNLKKDLTADLEGIDRLIGLGQRKIEASKRIKSRAAHGNTDSLLVFCDTMIDLVFVGGFTPNQNTFQEMQSSGNFSLIKSDSIKLKLMDLNQSYILINGAQEHIRSDYEVFVHAFHQYVDMGIFYDLNNSPLPTGYDANAPYMKFDSAYVENNTDILSEDVLALFDDKVFMNHIFLLEVNFTYMAPMLQGLKAEVTDIILLIDKEIAA